MVGWLQTGTSWQKGMIDQRCSVHGIKEAEQVKSVREERGQGPYTIPKVTNPWLIQVYSKVCFINSLCISWPIPVDIPQLKVVVYVQEMKNHCCFNVVSLAGHGDTHLQSQVLGRLRAGGWQVQGQSSQFSKSLIQILKKVIIKRVGNGAQW